MPRHYFTAALLILGLSSGLTQARDLRVEVEVLHIGGMLAPAELESLLADERLSIELNYHPTRLIEGVTARRERTLPLGSKLYAISQSMSLKSAQVERQGRSLRFQVAEIHPDHADYYRLHSVSLSIPIKSGLGRPQPDLSIDLLNPVPKSGAHETALYTRHGAFDLGLRLRVRWSDAQDMATAAIPACHADIQSLGNGQYRFRPQHRLAGLSRFLAPVVQSGPPARSPVGQRSWRLREPFPEPMTGWKLSNNHLLQLQIDGQTVEQLSLHAEQTGPGHCRRTRTYNALFAGGQIVSLQRSAYDDECGSEGDENSRSVEASWLDDGRLARYLVSTPKGTQSWDGFSAAMEPHCATGTAPSDGEVQALRAELQRIREAFLRP